MELLSELLFCCSVSLDGFTLGCSYGIRNLRSTIFTNIIAALICGTASALAIFFGGFFLMFFSPEFCTYLGMALLIFLGSYTVIKGLILQKHDSAPDTERKMTLKESTVISLMVSVDAFSAGLGYAMMGHTSLLIPIGVGVFHSLFISLGVGFSRRAIRHFRLSKRLLTVISGLIIIGVALSRLFF